MKCRRLRIANILKNNKVLIVADIKAYYISDYNKQVKDYCKDRQNNITEKLQPDL